MLRDEELLFVEASLSELDQAGVQFCLRSGREEFARWEPGGDIDVLILPSDLAQAVAILAEQGWSITADAGHRGHTFASAFVSGQWLKLDLVSLLRYATSSSPVAGTISRRVRESGCWVASPADRELHRQRRAELGREQPSWWERLLRRLPSRGRRGIVVAFMGPDGVGKSSVIGEVSRSIPVSVQRSYAGTGRRGEPPTSAPVQESVFTSLREIAFLLRKAAPAWLSQLGTWLDARRGVIVLLDRHPYDTLCSQPSRTSLGRRVELLLMTRMLPPPNLFVLLDAPTEVVLSRKDELDADTAERFRRGYRDGLAPVHTRVVSTDQPLPCTVAEALSLIFHEYVGRPQLRPADV